MELGDDGADVAEAGEHTVELRLVGGRDGEGGDPVGVVGHVELAEPARPVVVMRIVMSVVMRCATSAGGWLIWTPIAVYQRWRFSSSDARSPRFQDELLDALARLTATRLT